MSNLIERLRELANKFSEGWHDGIRIDASDIVDICDSVSALEQQAGEIAVLREALGNSGTRHIYEAPPGMVFMPDGTQAETERLKAENAELRKDAERYRWLRDNSAYVGVNPHARSCLWILRGIFEVPGQGFDAAIDAAMKGEK